MKTVSFSHMADATKEDVELILEDAEEDARELPNRLIAAVGSLKDFQGPLRVNRLEHSLQSATRAYRDEKGEDYVVAALLHDLGDHLAPFSHGEYVAALLRPFVSDRICWIIEHHSLFQAYYYAHHFGGDRNARDTYIDHPYYEDCKEFCEKYDQNCFGKDYESLPLVFFESMVQRVFAEPKYAAYDAHLWKKQQ